MTDAARLRVLTFTSLYPNAAQPRHGLFVAERLRHLRASGRIDAMVVAPVPWFPSSSPLFGRYATYARVPPREEHDGMTVLHPRYLSVPRVGMSIAPRLMAAGARLRGCAARAHRSSTRTISIRTAWPRSRGRRLQAGRHHGARHRPQSHSGTSSAEAPDSKRGTRAAVSSPSPTRCASDWSARRPARSGRGPA